MLIESLVFHVKCDHSVIFCFVASFRLKTMVLVGIQAKTTKKIVLRLQCQSCKHVTQHPIKVITLLNRILVHGLDCNQVGLV